MTETTTGRISALDTLRGFALCGILPVNIWQTLHLEDPPRWLVGAGSGAGGGG